MAALNKTAANAAIRHVIAQALGLNANDVRPANQTAPTGKQDHPFTTVLVTEYTPVGQDNRIIQDLGVAHQLTETMVGTRYVSADVQSLRAGANDQLTRLRALLSSSSFMGVLRHEGLALISCGPVLDISQEVDDYWEERALSKLEFYVTAQEVITLSTFASVEITIQTEDVTITREVNLDVDS